MKIRCYIVLMLSLLPGGFAFASVCKPASSCEANTVASFNEQPAKRVVALNWSAAEILLSLDVIPVGVTSIKGYKKWQSNTPVMPDSVVELGRREEPSLDLLSQLNPDLIIGYQFRHQRLAPLLSEIAPTYIYQQYGDITQPEFRYFTQQQQVLLDVAARVGKTQQAQQLLAQMEQNLVDNRARLEQAGLAGKGLVLGKFVGMGYGLRVFGQTALVASVSEQLGLRYDWHAVLPGKDFTHLQLTQLADIETDFMVLVADESNIGARMTKSPVWPFLPFVQQGKVVTVEPLWSFGGPISVMKMSDGITQALLRHQSNKEPK